MTLIDFCHQFQFEHYVDSDNLWVEAPGISFETGLSLQSLAREHLIQTNQNVYMACSHRPNVVTWGRGDRQNQAFQNISQTQVGVEEYHIKRGGGATLHHDQQWIFYPIVKLNATDWTLTHHLSWLIKIITKTLKTQSIVSYGLRNPLGVWVDQKKIASIGVGVDRFITQHGLAFNLDNSNVLPILSQLNPCGLSARSYTCLSSILGKKIYFKEFHSLVLNVINEIKLEEDELI
jgi:lipoate-protein ligase B